MADDTAVEPAVEPEIVFEEPEDLTAEAPETEETQPEVAEGAGDGEEAVGAVEGDQPAEADAATANLMAHAETLGISADYAERLNTAGLLDETVLRDERLVQAARQQQEQQAQQPQAAPAAQPPAEEGPEFAFDAEEFPGQAQELRKTREQVQQLQQVVAVMAKQSQATHQDAFETRFDAFVEGIGEGWAETFGKGSTKNLPKTGAHMENRIKLSEAMQVLSEGYRARGHTVSEADLLQSALQMQFGGAIAQTVRKEISGQLRKRSRQITTPPTQRDPDTSLQSREDLALAAIRADMADKGIEDPDADVEMKDEL